MSISIEAAPRVVAEDLADPSTHSDWATEFIDGPPLEVREDGSVVVNIPAMGGPSRFKVEADLDRGILDLYLAPGDVPFGPPLPVRLVANGDGVDVLWVLSRPAMMDDEQWVTAQDSMARELENLKTRHEA
ncbi:MAG: hypothetical protein ACC654_11455 [Acidimicrobiia bacterium]